ncbi:5-carboxymethyl-2-hydroxymuconate semialdehyde dehydrogenase, partial [Micromonospora sp. AMSO12t]
MAGRAPDGPGLLRNFVGGEFVEGGRRFVKRSPVTGEPVFEVVEADRACVDDAV